MCLASLVIFLFLVPEPSVIGMTTSRHQKTDHDHQKVSASSKSPRSSLPDTEKTLRRSTSASRLIDSAYESDGEAGGSSTAVSGSGKAISFLSALQIPGVIE